MNEEKNNWPDWLKNADTENAQVQITEYGRVIWHGGVWHDGFWHDGVWRGGVWHDGFWRGGVDNPTRCMFPVRGSGDRIMIGCLEFAISEARALCDGGDLPDEAPPRDSENGRLLRAAVLAQIAWQEALQDNVTEADQ